MRQAAQILRDGGVIAYPTDSSYALGCHVGDADAAQRMRAIRGVDDKHLLTLVCGDLADAGRFARLDNWQFRIVRQGIPGPFTFLLPATREVPRRLLHRKRHTVGIRVPDHAGRARAARGAARADPVDDADPARRRRAAERCGRDPRRAASRAVDLVIDAGPCATCRRRWSTCRREPGTIVRLGGGDPARLGLDGRRPLRAARGTDIG